MWQAMYHASVYNSPLVYNIYMNLTLVKKVNEAKDTKSFFFSTEEKLNFSAGQYIYITLPKLNYPDERGSTRHFTISSSPTEGDLIRVTVRVRQESGYKKTLDELPMGTVVEGKGPQGTFLFEKNTNPNIFLAGGIGITPFRSMIKWNIDKSLNIPIHLIYSNGDSEFVFKEELDKWQKENDFLKIEYIDTSVFGHLDLEAMKKIFSFWHLAFGIPTTWWLVGPPAFVNAMEEILEKMNISENNIKSEKFSGY